MKKVDKDGQMIYWLNGLVMQSAHGHLLRKGDSPCVVRGAEDLDGVTVFIWNSVLHIIYPEDGLIERKTLR